jgi:phosphoglycolate phosphatase-like HAD superfamily hydrolase|tara:strand:- start:5969 stop:6409 length:441 start_codon:yes stop_codon:yes gene_type:complete
MADIVFDVDGTLMDINHRRHYVEQKPKDFEAFRKDMIHDTPNEDVVMMAKVLREAGHRIIIATGRMIDDIDITVKQLKDAGVWFDAIYTRSKSDKYKPDSEVKEQYLEFMKADGFTPTIVFDDRDKVVDMWRRNGLRVFQVDRGDF